MNENLILRTVVQRVSFAEVTINNISCGTLANGLVLLFGVGVPSADMLSVFNSPVETAFAKIRPVLERLSEKILALRIFSDNAQKMNLSVVDICGGIYVVSQFTIFADCKNGNRPSFVLAAKPTWAQPIYEEFLTILKNKAPQLPVLSGQFGANMQVKLCNDGPVTLNIELPVFF